VDAAFPTHITDHHASPERDNASGRGLLIDDSDALAPLAFDMPDDAGTLVDTTTDPAACLTPVHPAYASATHLQAALDWIGDPRPAWGWRRAVWFATGINLGPSRRERRLRRAFVLLYQISYDHKETTR